MYEHMPPAKGRRVPSGAARNTPTPTTTVEACAPGYTPENAAIEEDHC